MSSRPAWATHQVHGQPKLHSETLKKQRLGIDSVVHQLPKIYKVLGFVPTPQKVITTGTKKE
jgi:hypothetical protein